MNNQKKAEQAVLAYIKDSHPGYKNAETFDEIRYAYDFTPAEVVEIITRYYNNET